MPSAFAGRTVALEFSAADMRSGTPTPGVNERTVSVSPGGHEGAPVIQGAEQLTPVVDVSLLVDRFRAWRTSSLDHLPHFAA